MEPLHPAFAAERSVLVTLRQTNDMLDQLDSPQVGVAINAYYAWWDANQYAQIARAAGA